jgi:hypothetical protein
MTPAEVNGLALFGGNVGSFHGPLLVVSNYINKQGLPDIVEDEARKQGAVPQWRSIHKLLQLVTRKLKAFVKETRNRAKALLVASNDAKADFAATRKKAVTYYRWFEQVTDLFTTIAQFLKKIADELKTLDKSALIAMTKFRNQLKIMKAYEQDVHVAYKTLMTV